MSLIKDRILNVFNLNDPRWGRNDDGASEESQSELPKSEPKRPDISPPDQRGRGKASEAPPDLDQIWQDFNRKLGGLFGGQGGGRNSNNGQSGPKNAGFSIGIMVFVVVCVWLASGIFRVNEGYQAVITQFGVPQKQAVGAGLQWRLPYPIQRHEIVSVKQMRSVDVGRDSIIKATGLRESAMLTADENIVEIKFAVQYSLSDAHAYLFESKSPDAAVVQAAETAVREVVGKMTMDQAISEERDQIATRTQQLIQSIVDRYKIGIIVAGVNLQQGGVRPPEQVQSAFDDVLKAGQERSQAKNEAEAYANDVIPRAVGAASRLKEEADAYKAKIVAQAEGDAQRFNSVFSEYQKAPRVIRDRMYIDAMQEVYSSVTKVLIDSRQGSNLLYLPLDKLMHLTGESATSTQGSAQVSAIPAAPAATSAATVSNDPRARDNARSRDSR